MSEDPGDIAATWQAEHPGGAQVDITLNPDGPPDIGPTIYPDSEPD